MMTTIKGVDIDDFTASYLVTSLWASTVSLPMPEDQLSKGYMDVDEDHPLHDIRDGDPYDDHFGLDDFTVEALRSACEDCTKFQEDNADDLSDENDGQTGHDFFLTRNGHGRGYWEPGDYEEAVGQRLTEGCKVFGEVYIFVDDEGALHFE